MNTSAPVLAKPAILAAYQRGDIFISPFNERQVKNSSYDVRLGEWYYEEQPGAAWNHSNLLNPYDKDSVAAMWGEPKKAQPLDRDLPGIPKGTPVIQVPRGGFLLCHTEEFIGTTDLVHTTMIKARSTTGRSGIQVCACAGWGDISWAQRWTLEVVNNTKRDVLLVSGRRIGQIVFIPTTGIEPQDAYHQGGKYQSSDVKGKTHEQLLAEWKPEMMLPKAYLDYEVLAP